MTETQTHTLRCTTCDGEGAVIELAVKVLTVGVRELYVRVRGSERRHHIWLEEDVDGVREGDEVRMRCACASFGMYYRL